MDDGDLPFDRTMKISTSEHQAKTRISQRIPVNLETIRGLLAKNAEAWEQATAPRMAAANRKKLESEMRKPAFRRAQMGFNNNIKFRDTVFHVQTEDSGLDAPHVITHLFADGGRTLIADQEGRVSVWRDSTRSLEGVVTDRPGVSSLLLDRSGRAVFVGYQDGTLRRQWLNPDDALAEACQVLAQSGKPCSE